MTAKILYHPRIFMGAAAEIARLQGGELGQEGIVHCADCRHAVQYDLHPTVGWCVCFARERAMYFGRECRGFEGR